MRRHITWAAVVLLLLVMAGGAAFYLFPGLFFEPALRVLRLTNGVSRCEVQVEDRSWVYLDGGQGEAVLFVHGFAGDKDRWGAFRAINGGIATIVSG